jgi:hypothetical protein
MSLVFDKIIPLAEKIDKKLALVGTLDTTQDLHNYPWFNKIYRSFDKFRRAHIEVLDIREKNNMWIMHVTIFPHVDDDAPIFGFDIVCTGNKVSGIFHDFSITTNENHPLVKGFESNVKKCVWKRERELPDWGKAIFSDNMIAAGGSNTEQELEQIVNVCMNNLDFYLMNLDSWNRADVKKVVDAQNRYCKYQKQNPYPIKMLINIGLSEKNATEFVENILFPEYKS